MAVMADNVYVTLKIDWSNANAQNWFWRMLEMVKHPQYGGAIKVTALNAMPPLHD